MILLGLGLSEQSLPAKCDALTKQVDETNRVVGYIEPNFGFWRSMHASVGLVEPNQERLSGAARYSTQHFDISRIGLLCSEITPNTTFTPQASRKRAIRSPTVMGSGVEIGRAHV